MTKKFDIQHWTSITRFVSTVILMIFFFMMPYILLGLGFYFNHVIGGIIADAYKLKGFIRVAVEWILLPCSTMLFGYPLLESFFKQDGTLDDMEKKKLMLFLVAPILGYSVMSGSYIYGALVAKTIPASPTEVVFTIALMIICGLLEMGAGIAAMPNRRLMFSDIINKSNESKKEDKKDKPDAPTNGTQPLAGHS
ncbi:MAG: hypothetical protein NZZ41_02540 [Candidatus Dojkabacteria bacterium]|nr:hypothetical protein [Candidatus Dojkabacteria bacterium]